MVNINPSATSFDNDHHTSYLRLKPEWCFMEEFWKGNVTLDRCWIPWDWCEIRKQQRNNNSIVIFAPGNDTFHAIKADYDHLPNQRTQLYGNLRFNEYQGLETTNWEEFVVSPVQKSTTNRSIKQLLNKYLPHQFVAAIKNSKRSWCRRKS